MNRLSVPIEHTQTRLHWDDGTFSDVTCLHFPPDGFTFAAIDLPPLSTGWLHLRRY